MFACWLVFFSFFLAIWLVSGSFQGVTIFIAYLSVLRIRVLIWNSAWL